MLWNKLHRDSSRLSLFRYSCFAELKKAIKQISKFEFVLSYDVFIWRTVATPYFTIPLLRELQVFLIPSWVSPIRTDNLLKISSSSSTFYWHLITYPWLSQQFLFCPLGLYTYLFNDNNCIFLRNKPTRTNTNVLATQLHH